MKSSGTFLLFFLIAFQAVSSANTCIAPKPVKISGALCGRVFDPTGAVVPNAVLHVLDATGGTVSDTQVDATGDFLVAYLAKGRYRLTAARPWVIDFGEFEIGNSKAMTCARPVSVYLGGLEL